MTTKFFRPFKFFLACFAFFQYSIAQGVLISHQAGQPHSSAGLELDFHDKGFLGPRITSAQRNNILNPALGLMIYNTTSQCFEGYFPSGWKSIECHCTALPDAGFVASSNPALLNASVAFTPNSMGQHQWVFQGGTPASSMATSPSVLWNQAGSFAVVHTVTDLNGCSNSDTQTVVVSASYIYSENFPTGNVSQNSSQCQNWVIYLANLNPSGWLSVTLSGAAGSVTCNTPSAANQLAAALHNGTPTSVQCNGQNWQVGVGCGPNFGIEISLTGALCSCNAGYVLRPCIDNQNWGGINGPTCNANGQNITLTFQ